MTTQIATSFGNMKFEVEKNIPDRFYETAISECKNFVLAKWKRITDARGKMYSFRLNDYYRILIYPDCAFAGVYNHNTYLRKINNLKRK
jgi:hypothetical protein